MIPVGYMLKRVESKPDWLMAEVVQDVYSLSGCVSENFADYINYWRHNGYWLFNSPQIIESLAKSEDIDITGTSLFYYEAYEFEFVEDGKKWLSYSPTVEFPTQVLEPFDKQLEGFDVTTLCVNTNPECSPLSCNSLATEIKVNQHCLFNTFQEAKEALEKGLFKNSEPGPYRIFAVYTIKGLTTHSSGTPNGTP